jgi:uncharacterized damage-inducible protein DinB
MDEQRAKEQRTNEHRAKASWTMDREDFLHHFEQVRERTMRVVSKGCGRELAEGRDGVIAYMERMHAEAMEIFRAMTDEDWLRKGTSPDGKPVTAWRMLRAMLEHEVHHRGQMYVYLGILGVPAHPLYTLNELQLRQLSV